MQIYEVRISHGARVDMAELRKFLKSMMTVEGAIRYANNMREVLPHHIREVRLLPILDRWKNHEDLATIYWIMLAKQSKIYVIDHNGFVGSAIWNNLLQVSPSSRFRSLRVSFSFS